MYSRKKRRLLRCLTYIECKTKDWDGLNNIYNRELSGNKNWVFRGEKRRKDDKHNAVHRTGLEKGFSAFGIGSKRDKRRWEKDLIREFKRKLYLYETQVPASEDKLEWLALMQHYGAPTRLLDFTYSFYVACYFAVAEMDCVTEVTEVWAFDANWFSEEEKVKRIIGINANSKEKSKFDEIKKRMEEESNMTYMDEDSISRNAIVSYLMENPKPFVYSVTPFRLNERLTIQHGTFLFPGDVTRSFIENLSMPEEYRSKSGKNLYRVIMKLNRREKARILRELDGMNINQSVLFPGLEGFARTLRTRFAFPDRRPPNI